MQVMTAIVVLIIGWVGAKLVIGVFKKELRKGILEAYRREGVEIPFPQMDVHLKHE